MIPFFLFVIAIVGAAIHLGVSKKKRTIGRITSVLLTWLFALPVGLWGVFASYAHTFLADEVARSIGWEPGSPFQFEVAMANLAYGLTGLLAVRASQSFRWAVSLYLAIFYWGAAYGHIRDIIVNQNYAPNNSGFLLFMDIFLPAALIVLLWVNQRTDEVID